jgi:hypothetical protein
MIFCFQKKFANYTHISNQNLYLMNPKNSNVQRTTYNVQRTTYNVQRTTYNVQRTTYNVQRTTLLAA